MSLLDHKPAGGGGGGSGAGGLLLPWDDEFDAESPWPNAYSPTPEAFITNDGALAGGQLVVQGGAVKFESWLLDVEMVNSLAILEVVTPGTIAEVSFWFRHIKDDDYLAFVRQTDMNLVAQRKTDGNTTVFIGGFSPGAAWVQGQRRWFMAGINGDDGHLSWWDKHPMDPTAVSANRLGSKTGGIGSDRHKVPGKTGFQVRTFAESVGNLAIERFQVWGA